MAFTFLFSIFLWLTLDGIMSIEEPRAWNVYVVAKGVSLLLLVGISIYVLLKEEFSNNDVVLALMTVVFQIVPLLLRYVLKGGNPLYSLAAIISFLSVITYFVGFALIDLSNDKQKR